MNRQIKFRGFGGDGDNEKWVYGVPEVNDYAVIHTKDRECITIYPETLGQYIGLTDVNGTEIYEGDIFKDSYYDWDNEKEIEYYITVKWDEPSYGFIVSQSDYHDEVEMHHLAYKEIIGNVHDNPELQKLFEQ